jgi:hypothetical protein
MEQCKPTLFGLRQKTAATDDVNSANKNLAAQIHQAIRDGEYASLSRLVKENEHQVLWESNSSGWTAIHYAASHFLPAEWWVWILSRAAVTSGDEFFDSKTALGETCFDIFLRSYIDPLPWQSIQVKNSSKHLLEAIDFVCQDDRLIAQTRKAIKMQERNQCHSVPRSLVTGNRQVLRCVRFWSRLDILCRAAADRDLEYPRNETLVSVLVRCGTCPEPIARLLLVLYPEYARIRTPKNSLPLHTWTAHSKSDFTSLDTTGMLYYLISAYPQAVTSSDEQSRLPLQTALLSGNPWCSLRPLFEAAPTVLEQRDPVTYLPCICLSVLAPQKNVEVRARQNIAGNGGLDVMWKMLTKEKQKASREQARAQLEVERLDLIFNVLLAFPGALWTF